MGFFRQEYWNGFPFTSRGDLPDPGIRPSSPVSPASQVDSLPTELLGKPTNVMYLTYVWENKVLNQMEIEVLNVQN